MPEVETESHADLVETARRFFELQTIAMSATVPGSIEKFLECFADDLVWRFPLGAYAGTHQAKASFEEFFRYACNYFSSGLTFQLDHVLSDGKDTVAFEFRDEELNKDNAPYKANVVISYTLHNNKIIGYREYFG